MGRHIRCPLPCTGWVSTTALRGKPRHRTSVRALPHTQDLVGQHSCHPWNHPFGPRRSPSPPPPLRLPAHGPAGSALNSCGPGILRCAGALICSTPGDQGLTFIQPQSYGSHTLCGLPQPEGRGAGAPRVETEALEPLASTPHPSATPGFRLPSFRGQMSVHGLCTPNASQPLQEACAHVCSAIRCLALPSLCSYKGVGVTSFT